VSSAVRQLRAVAGLLRSRHADDRRDKDAVAELQVGPDALGLPPGVEVRWLGVAGYAITHEGTTLLIDPYVSRGSLQDLMRRRHLASDRRLLDAYVPRADAILLGHTHFDHALDAPALAARDHATVYGGTSAATLLNVHGLAAQSVRVEPHHRYEIGPFTVTFVPSVHAAFVLGRIPMEGEITCDHVDEMRATDFRCGEVWGIRIEVAGATIYHQGSADLLDDELAAGHVDVLLCGVAGRHATPDYLQRLLPRVDPRTLVISHHDDFLRPVDGPQGFTFGVQVHRLPDDVAAVAPDTRVVTLPSPSPIPVP
jgi:L-ascorbate metabolism protein UlaG (beta-lactamase superfamily)